MKQFILFFFFCASSFFAFGQEFQSYWNDANTAFKDGDYDKAIKDYRSYIVLGGHNNAEFITKAEKCKTLLGNADVLFDAGNYSEAAANYQEMLNLNPSDSKAQKRIAECNRLAHEKEQPYQAIAPQSSNSTSITNPTTPKKNNRSGIKGGANLSSISNNTMDIDFSPQMNIGFHVGILFNMRFGVFGLQPELLYSRQGFKSGENVINFDYVTAPLMIKLNFGKNHDRGNFNFEIGPYFSYLMKVTPNSTLLIMEEYNSYTKAAEVNLSDLEKGKDVGVAVGAEYEFNSGLIVGGRYYYGMSDLANNLQWKNKAASISLGFIF